MNLYHDLPSFASEKDQYINVVVDVPKGSSNKYEYDEKGGYLKLDRVLHHQMFYPFDYGFIPQTHYEDGDAVDVVLLVNYPTFPGCVVKARAIGAIKTTDEAGKDLKIIAVPITKVDPRFKEIESYEQLGSHLKDELLLHFKEIKKLEKEKYDKVFIEGFESKEFAMQEIKRAIESYHTKGKE